MTVLNKSTEKKEELHPRNIHNGRYDLPKLVEAHPELDKFVAKNRFGDLSIDFFNPEAVKALNRALLSLYYNINYWEIPATSLTPPIPGRADYIHYVADLLGKKNSGSEIKCLDIGVGASCIYPIIGNSQYGWSFVGSDIDLKSIKNCQSIIDNNIHLHGKIDIRHQSEKSNIFIGIIEKGEKFDLTICNPPFHNSADRAKESTLRKTRNLKSRGAKNGIQNFGGAANELWCDGGEIKFIARMIEESTKFKRECSWFTTLVSKEDNLKVIAKLLKQVAASEYKIIEMKQGNKRSRIVAWRF